MTEPNNNLQQPELPTQQTSPTPELYGAVGSYVSPTQQPEIEAEIPEIAEQSELVAEVPPFPPLPFPPPESAPPQLGPMDFPQTGNPPPPPSQTTEFNRVYEMVKQILDAERPPDILDDVTVFPAQLTGTSGQFKSLTMSGTKIVPFIGGVSNTSATGQCIAVPILSGGTMTNGDRGIMLEIKDTNSYRYMFVSARPSGVVPVLLKQNGGSDGSWPSTAATWSYDLYALSDTGYVTKLNLSGPIVPYASRAEAVNSSVTPAADGTVGFAYYDITGIIGLYLVKDLIVQNTCADTGGGSSPSFMGV